MGVFLQLRRLYIFLVGILCLLGCQGQIQGYATLSQVDKEGVDNNQQQQHQVMGNPTMFHYQMYPAQQNHYPQPHPQRKRCILTQSGMKCKYRRDGGGGDSYTTAAQYGAPSTSYGVPMGGWGSEEEEKGGGESGIAGLLGLIGLKGLKGVKGLKGLVTLLPFLPLLGPILAPIIAVPFAIIGIKLILLGLAFLFKPIGRSSIMDYNFLMQNASFSSIPRMVVNVLESEECVERIACGVRARVDKQFGTVWMDRLANSIPERGHHYFGKIKRGLQIEDGMKSGDSHGFEECMKFECNPESIFVSNNNNKRSKSKSKPEKSHDDNVSN